MAVLIKTDGTRTNVTPKDPKRGFSCEEVHTLIGCAHFEMTPSTDPDLFLLVDENGKLIGKPLNIAATKIHKYAPYDCIVGDALLVDLSKGELQ